MRGLRRPVLISALVPETEGDRGTLQHIFSLAGEHQGSGGLPLAEQTIGTSELEFYFYTLHDW